MELIGLLGFVAFIVTSLVVGCRLALLSRRTRQFPELAIGLSFLLAGCVGSTLTLVGQNATTLSPEARLNLAIAAASVGHAGYGFLVAFVWRVFRSRSTAGAIGFAACLLGFATGFTLQLQAAEPTPEPVVTPGFFVSLSVQVAAYGWAAAESFSYWWTLRKRVELGLAAPLVANRFLLWGIGTLAIILIWLHLGWALLTQETATLSAASYLVIAILGFVCAGAIWLAFFPPRAYARRFEGAASELGPGA